MWTMEEISPNLPDDHPVKFVHDRDTIQDHAVNTDERTQSSDATEDSSSNEKNDEEYATEEEELHPDEIQQFLLRNPNNPGEPPEVGDVIEFVDDDTQPPTLVRAIVKPMTSKLSKKWKGWFNIFREGASRSSSVDLTAVRWTYAQDRVFQVDGNYTVEQCLGSTEDIYIEDSLSEQESIRGRANSEYFSNLLHLLIAQAQFEVSEKIKKDCPALDLQLPEPPLLPC